MKFQFWLLPFLLIACAPWVTSPRLIKVYATPAARPWLSELYTCAAQIGITPQLDPQNPDLILQLGETLPGSTGFSYAIGTEDLVIAVHPQSPLIELTVEQARELFAGRGDPTIQIWAYASTTDIQTAIDLAFMHGLPITSLARLAFTPEHMVQALSSDRYSAGIVPRWALSSLRELRLIASVPVLALTPSSPQGDLLFLLSCLQH